MKRSLVYVIFIAFTISLLAGCNLPSRASQNSGEMAQTYAAQTVEARLTENAAGGDQGTDNQDDSGEQPAQPSDTPQPSNTPIPSNTPEPSDTPKPAATATESVPCNQAGFVKDVTVPDGTKYGPGDTFTKTWRLRNTGSCNWNGDYELVFDSGDKMNGGDVVNLSIGTIEPDETVDISVDLKAPNTPGDYKGEWLLRSDDNEVFGLGKNDVPFYVEIEVVEEVAFDVLSTNHYTCSGDKYVAIRVKNTGTEGLQSSAIGVKNLDTDTIVGVYFGHNNTPFTENDDDCPPMGINDLEPGDVYYLTYNLGSASAEFEFSIELCNEEDGNGDCVKETAVHDVP